jgi:hypothetical protein
MSPIQETWFGEEPQSETVKSGNNITLKSPQPTKWKVNEVINEYIHQISKL